MSSAERDPLGASLRKARQDAGLSGEQLAERMGWNASTGKSKVSKIEGGRQTPSVDEVTAWAGITGISDRLRDQLIGMVTHAEATRSNYRKRAARGQGKVQKEYSDRAAETTRFTFFETFIIPRYLQVPEYTRVVVEEHYDKHGITHDVSVDVQEKQSTVRHLYDPAKTFTFLLDEPILRRRRFPPSIMRPQLDRLMSVIGLDNVTLAIYPSLSRPVNSYTESSFEIFDDEAFIETALNDEKTFLADDVERLEALFQRYWRDAVVGEDARPLILDAINNLPA